MIDDARNNLMGHGETAKTTMLRPYGVVCVASHCPGHCTCAGDRTGTWHGRGSRHCGYGAYSGQRHPWSYSAYRTYTAFIMYLLRLRGESCGFNGDCKRSCLTRSLSGSLSGRGLNANSIVCVRGIASSPGFSCLKRCSGCGRSIFA